MIHVIQQRLDNFIRFLLHDKLDSVTSVKKAEDTDKWITIHDKKTRLDNLKLVTRFSRETSEFFRKFFGAVSHHRNDFCR